MRRRKGRRTRPTEILTCITSGQCRRESHTWSQWRYTTARVSEYGKFVAHDTHQVRECSRCGANEAST